MLRRTENVQVFYRRDFWSLLTGKHRILLQVGRKEHTSSFRITKVRFSEMADTSQNTPVAYLTIGERTYWRFADRWHTDDEGLAQADVHALLVTRAMRQEDRVNRARTIASQGRLPAPSPRGAVPDDVKMLVWNRDAGQCRGCGDTSELQFDHIIPVSRGGAAVPENLQILCGPCNRRKGASLV
jgi:5-methylcytosine-specific restriction endonuclease McrA